MVIGVSTGPSRAGKVEGRQKGSDVLFLLQRIDGDGDDLFSISFFSFGSNMIEILVVDLN